MAGIKKPLRDLERADIEALIHGGEPESDQLELKEDLPCRDGRDSWHTGAQRIGDYARNKILAEVVAFANSYGGDVVIGIRESDDKPARAATLVPLPDCVELAHRLAQQASACIEPAIPAMHVAGVVTGGSGEGVVVLRVPRSRLAPHRLMQTKDCYHRVRDSTEAMTMRQIQDLTFAVARGLQQVDARLAGLREEFLRFSGARTENINFKKWAVGIRAVPATSDLYMPVVHNVDSVCPQFRQSELTVAGNGYELVGIRPLEGWRPILRGTQNSSSNGTRGHDVRLYCDGAIGYSMFQQVSAISGAEPVAAGRGHFLYPGWLLADVVNAIEAADRVRNAAGAESCEFALEIEIFMSHPLPVYALGDTWHRVEAEFRDPIVLPRYAVGEPATWNSLVALVWRDFWNAVGVPAESDGVRLTDWPAQ